MYTLYIKLYYVINLYYYISDNFCFSITSKHINRSMDQLLSQKSFRPDNQSSLLQRVLSLDPSNPKLAQILSLDMFIVGIDTVKSKYSINI